MGKGIGVHCYPLDQEARRAHLAPKAPPYVHPAPEVAARPAIANEIPAGAKHLIKAATAAGWRTVVTYARGTTLTGRPPKVVECVAVFFRRVVAAVIERAVATWIDGKFDTAYLLPIHRVGARELRVIIDAPAVAP